MAERSGTALEGARRRRRLALFARGESSGGEQLHLDQLHFLSVKPLARRQPRWSRHGKRPFWAGLWMNTASSSRDHRPCATCVREGYPSRVVAGPPEAAFCWGEWALEARKSPWPSSLMLVWFMPTAPGRALM